MKYKIICFVLLMELVFSLAACSADDKTVIEDEITDDKTVIEDEITDDKTIDDDDTFPELKIPISSEVPPQPILFDTIEDAIDFIANPDLSGYDEEECQVYQKMVSVFQTVGYITTVTHDSAARYDDTARLFPEATLEDIGVAYWFKLNDVLYQVMIYNTKAEDEYSVDVQTDTMQDYYTKRYPTIKPLLTTLPTNHSLITSVGISETGDGRICAHSLIDNDRYVVVRAKKDSASAFDLVAFINGLLFDQVAVK